MCVWLHVLISSGISSHISSQESPPPPRPSSHTFQSIPEYVLSHFPAFNSWFSFSLPSRYFFFLSSTSSFFRSLICFPNPSTIFLQSCLHLSPSLSLIASPSLHLSGLSAFIHLKPQLMMNETNLPRAQTWVALWDSAQLPTGRSGLIPYSWAASTPVLLVVCNSRDPSLSWQSVFKVLPPHSDFPPSFLLCSHSSL